MGRGRHERATPRHQVDRAERALQRSRWTNLTMAVGMFAAGVLSGSSALMAEAIHDSFDGLSDWVSLQSQRLAQKPPSARFTLGRGKAVALAALGSSLTMLGTATGVVIEGVVNLLWPGPINVLVMGLTPLVSLGANLFIARGFRGGKHGPADHRLHAEGSLQHALSEAKASLAVVAAAGVIEATGWTWVDAAVATAIAWRVGLRPALRLGRRSLRQLLDAAPIDPGLVERAIRSAPGVRDVGGLEVTDPNCDGGVRVRASVQLESGFDPLEAKRSIDPQLRGTLAKEHKTLVSSAYAVVGDAPGALYESLPRAVDNGHGHEAEESGRHRRQRRQWSLDLSGLRMRATAGRHRLEAGDQVPVSQGRRRRRPSREMDL